MLYSESAMQSAAPDDLLTRKITPADADAVAGLSDELGYPVASAIMKQRIEAFEQISDHVVYVACLAGKVVGWIDVGVSRHLQSEPRAEIGGLVVSREFRGGGIGRRLVAQAESWARQLGLKSVIVRSQIARERAHGFYLQAGYARTKTSAAFTKTLA